MSPSRTPGWLARRLQRLRRAALGPFLRGRHPPEYGARGVYVGLLVGLTPTFGLQVPLVALVWAVVRQVWPARRFSLLVASAWTLISNPVTVVPIYYVFAVTGRVILGRWNRLRRYEVFEEELSPLLPDHAGWLDSAGAHLATGLERFGLPLVVGSLPWALLVSWAGYRWSLGLIRRRRARRDVRRRRRRGDGSGSPPEP